MASSQDDEDSDEWDKSTSEIQSEDSDELFDSRPNRWRGLPQSWRTITEEDRLTYNALERLRNQDLSVHLYNAFALRQTPQKANAGPGSGGEELVPPDDFMKRTADEDEAFTLRRLERETPSCKLEEAVSANILRFAKEKFSKRRLGETPPSPGCVKIKPESVSLGNESLTSEAGSEDGEDTDSENGARGQQQQRTRAPIMALKPAVATDDDISYEFIRPSARSVLEKLDQTLSILHNARMLSAQNLIDEAVSSSEDDYEHDDELHRSRPTSRASSGRARSRSMSRMSPTEREITAASETKATNRGRPRKYIQMEGESMQDFLERRAKAQKKKRPVPLDDEDEDGATTAAEGHNSRRKRRRRRTRPREDMTEEQEYWMQKKLERLNLRDWSDVMGAAALAGFSPKVIARATQRCANLFGQGMEMHTINEAPASSGKAGIETRRYEPGGPIPPSSSESDLEEEGLVTRQARSISRHHTPGKPVLSALLGGGEHAESPKKRQRRSSSHGQASSQHYCPHADCSRAVQGFDRLFNLKRHLKLVHGGALVEEKTMQMEEHDLDGGVHRDGFLEPIRVQKGWRAEDTRKRAKRRASSKRQRQESLSEDNGSNSGQSLSGESEGD
ncbi:hypothetical protein SLS53_005500 [Cytospora paraplurivora]|uniref:Rrn9 domain-containing protein n=1 Tax=Cytospora paraplurivora TaxID=2898453 RepID=A0AAN9U4N8_9PEZI